MEFTREMMFRVASIERSLVVPDRSNRLKNDTRNIKYLNERASNVVNKNKRWTYERLLS